MDNKKAVEPFLITGNKQKIKLLSAPEKGLECCNCLEANFGCKSQLLISGKSNNVCDAKMKKNPESKDIIYYCSDKDCIHIKRIKACIKSGLTVYIDPTAGSVL